MSNPKPHCSASYHKLVGAELETFGHGVATGIYGNTTTFATPPITAANYTALLETYHDDSEAYKNGGKSQKGAYLTSKTNLMNALDTLADYVDELPGVDSDMITLAGYTPTKTGESQAVVPASPVVDSIEQGAAGVLTATCKTVAGAESYGCVVSAGAPLDLGALTFTDGRISLSNYTGTVSLIVTKGRKKTITNLNPKTEYWFYFFAANSAGVSPLGAGVSKVCL